jgi:probable HAF family extracellular repeat protein
MKSTKLARIFTASVLIAIFGNLLRAQETAQKYHPKPKPNRYTFVDLGTLGGPVTYGTDDQIHVHLLNDSGVVSASSDTSIPDPNGPDFCWNLDCFLSHAFRWKDGVMTDLGALPGTNVSEGGGINSHGWSVGLSENGLIDPLLGARELRAILWKDGQILDLGTLGGNQSIAGNLNNRGQVVGFAANAILDSFSRFGWERKRGPFYGKAQGCRIWEL